MFLSLDPNSYMPIILLSPSLPFLFQNQSLQNSKDFLIPKQARKRVRKSYREIREMKIQCDVCDKVEASVFCAADQAALCHGCDRSIHHANKLAGKHTRFSLLHPTSKDSPLCDICQERRAYLFCREDRAVLCRECDLLTHIANEHTQKHSRFLFTGVKLSACSLDPPSSSSNGADLTEAEVRRSRSNTNRPRSVSNENFSSSSIVNSLASASCKVEDNMVSDTGSVSTSSISEYLIETIPGYCFEDLLDASFPPNGFCKNYEHQPIFHDQDLQVSTCLYPLEALVPQAQARVQSPRVTSSNLPQIGSLVGVKEIPKANAAKEIWKWTHNGRTVPEISALSIKKCRRSR